MLPREALHREAYRLLERFLEEARSLAPRCVILFGSYAKGNFTEGSDIDVCLIAEKLPMDELARRSLKSIQSPRKIRAIGFYPEEFLQFLKGLRFIAYDIVSDGIPIYDDGFFLQAREVYEECLRKYGIVKEAKGWRFALKPPSDESPKMGKEVKE
ncbi:MAG: nucleotidyltransferase domain-containing protein [Candidatus Bathyarchaeia archaeon]